MKKIIKLAIFLLVITGISACSTSKQIPRVSPCASINFINKVA